MDKKMEIILKQNNKIEFWQYLDINPRLYDGIDLTGAEIEYLNDEFWDYQLRPKGFENHYRQAIRRAITRYKNLKAVEFCDRVFDIATSESIRNLTRDVTNNLSQTGSKTRTGTGSESETVSGSNTDKTANKELPMNSYGDDFDDIVDWSKGASNISETQGSDSRSTTGSNTINQSDQEALNKIDTIAEKDKDKFKEIRGQGVTLIKKIYDYILEPKALDYLVSEIEQCFILTV